MKDMRCRVADDAIQDRRGLGILLMIGLQLLLIPSQLDAQTTQLRVGIKPVLRSARATAAVSRSCCFPVLHAKPHRLWPPGSGSSRFRRGPRKAPGKRRAQVVAGCFVAAA